ncbi:MAG TPA: tail fiber domain-containing protein [Candidatus Udaeobacter sp.]|jgi:hypothetical protein|nr:tail fiber domain-containing protein [Candidatus Udaeobacter sp.]
MTPPLHAGALGNGGNDENSQGENNEQTKPMKTITNINYSAFTLFVLACFTLSPQLHAISPPPGGCYSNYCTAEGCNALQLLGSGLGNTGIGWSSLSSVGDSSFNTGVGVGALTLNSADSNTAVGAAALLLNTAGTQNTAIGTDALVYNANGNYNNAVGMSALRNNIDGFANNAVGTGALEANIHANSNTAIGDAALSNNDSTGHGIANSNTAVGAGALTNNVDGADNIALGVNAGSLASGNNNIYIGDAGTSDESNVIAIGALAATGTPYTKCFVGGVANVFPGSNFESVVIDSLDGQLGVTPSSARYKKDIKPMDKSSKAIFSLKPVTFHYKNDTTNTSQYGLIAEEVAKVNPALVALDKEGKPHSVQYMKIDAMLLNEFLKEHRTVQKQQKELDALKTELKKQAELVQKVSDKVESNKSVPQTVAR